MIDRSRPISRNILVGLPLLSLAISLTACGTSIAGAPTPEPIITTAPTTAAPLATSDPSADVRTRVDTAVANDDVPLTLNPISGFKDAYDLVNLTCQAQTASDNHDVVGNPTMALLNEITTSNEQLYGDPFSPGEDAALHAGVPIACPWFTADLDNGS